MQIADVMSALMMIFMFITVAFLYQTINEKETHKVKPKQPPHKEVYKINLNQALHDEFDKDLKKYNAVITDDNIFRFNAPFKIGKSEIPQDFKNILKDFFPRYITLLSSKTFKKEIEEIRVEGHTSKGWGDLGEKEAYLFNMELSQKRANNVLKYCYNIDNNIMNNNLKWLQQELRANGLSSSHPIYINRRLEIIDDNRSRRVEFKVVAKERKNK